MNGNESKIKQRSVNVVVAACTENEIHWPGFNCLAFGFYIVAVVFFPSIQNWIRKVVV